VRGGWGQRAIWPVDFRERSLSCCSQCSCCSLVRFSRTSATRPLASFFPSSPPPSARSGVEFVLKTFDGQWLSWEQGHHSSNFYCDLPLRT